MVRLSSIQEFTEPAVPQSMRLSDIQNLGVVDKPSILPVQEEIDKPSVLQRISTGINKSIGGVPSEVGKALYFYGEYLRNNDETASGNKPVFPSEVLGSRISNAGTRIYLKNQAALKKKFPEEAEGFSFAESLGGGSVSLAAAIGIGALAGSAGAGIAFGLSAKNQGFLEARQAGKGFKESNDISNMLGFAEGSLEFIGINRLLKSSGGIILRAAKGYITEFSQELSQTVVAGTIRFATGLREFSGKDSLIQLMTEGLQSGAVGGVLGSAASIPITIAQRDGVKSAFQEMGATEQEADIAANEVMKRSMDDVMSAWEEAENEDVVEPQAVQDIVISQENITTGKFSESEISAVNIAADVLSNFEVGQQLIKDEEGMITGTLVGAFPDALSKQGFTSAEIQTTVKKVTEGKSLTEKQGLIFEGMLSLAQEATGETATPDLIESVPLDETTAPKTEELALLDFSEKSFPELNKKLKSAIETRETRKIRQAQDAILKTADATIRDILASKTSDDQKVQALNTLLNVTFPNIKEAKEGIKEFRAARRAIRKQIKQAKPKVVQQKRNEETILKEKIRTLKTGFRVGKVATKKEIKSSQETIIKLLNSSKLLAKDRAKFIAKIKNTQTNEQLQKVLPIIEAKILELQSKQRSDAAIKRIKKAFKATKVKKVGDKLVGKITADTQKVIDGIKTIFNLSREEAFEKIQQNTEKALTSGASPELALENRLLALVAGTEEQSPEFLEEVADFVETVLATGKAIRTFKDIARQEQDQENIDSVIGVITSNKGAPIVTTTSFEDFSISGTKGKIATFASDNISWNDVMKVISFLNQEQTLGENETEFLDVFENEINEKVKFQELTQENSNAIKEIYGIKNDGDFVRKLADDSILQTVGTFENAFGEIVTIRMTKTEAIKRWMELQDPSLDETFRKDMGFTREIVEGIRDFLSLKDIAVSVQQLSFYRKYYNRVNKVYREQFGVDLSFNEFYSPIRRELIEKDFTIAEIFADIQSRATVNPTAFKAREKNVNRIKESSYYSVMQKHIHDIEHFIAWAEKIRTLKKVFGNSNVQNSIKARFGSKILGDINGFLDDFTRGSISAVKRFEGLEKWRLNLVKSVLPIKMSILVKQLSSFPAFADSIPVTEFTVGLLDFWSAPIKNAKILLGSDFLKIRGAAMERDLAIISESDNLKNFRDRPSWKNALALNIEMLSRFAIRNVEIGDKGAIVFGGWPVYRFHLNAQLKAGKSQKEAHEFAIDKFSRLANTTQQSAFLSEQSSFQRGGTFARLFTMFKSAPNQYFRSLLNATKGLALQKGSRTQHLKTLTIFHVILPLLFQFIASGGDPDDDELLRAGILGSLNGFFIIGDLMNISIRAALGMRQWSTDIPIKGIATDLARITRLLDQDEITWEDWQIALRGLTGVTGVVSGTPLKTIVDIGSGFNDIIEGQYEAGIKKALGYSPWLVEQGLKDGKNTKGSSRRRKLDAKRRAKRAKDKKR